MVYLRGVPIEFQSPDILDWVKLLRDILCAIKNIKLQFVLVFDGNDLDTQLPLGEATSFDSVPKVTAVKVRVLTINLQGLVPNERMRYKVGSGILYERSVHNLLTA